MPPKKGASYTRPGVAVAVRLAQGADDAKVWTRIAGQYDAMVADIMLTAKNDNDKQSLVVLDRWCLQDLAPRLQTKPRRDVVFDKDDLVQVVQWKFRIGKARPALWKHLRANTTVAIQTHVQAGLSTADEGDTKGALTEVSKLRGVGPATASAILSLSHPHLFCFMADEVIEALYDGKRGYTAAIYHDVNATCQALATRLGWTPRAVGRALWTAARLSATGKEDGTATTAVVQGAIEKKEATTRRPAKRRRTLRSTK
jgi:hypothetical protein